MSYLVRKIERAVWNDCDKEGSRIKADVVARCLRPTGSALSVWFAETEGDVAKAKLAMLANMNKLASVDYIVVETGEIEALGLSIIPSEPTAGPVSLKPLHRDIDDLDLDSLAVVARLVQSHIAGAKAKRLTQATCKEILKEAIANNVIDKGELDEGLSKKLFPVTA